MAIGWLSVPRRRHRDSGPSSDRPAGLDPQDGTRWALHRRRDRRHGIGGLGLLAVIGPWKPRRSGDLPTHWLAATTGAHFLLIPGVAFLLYSATQPPDKPYVLGVAAACPRVCSWSKCHSSPGPCSARSPLDESAAIRLRRRRIRRKGRSGVVHRMGPTHWCTPFWSGVVPAHAFDASEFTVLSKLLLAADTPLGHVRQPAGDASGAEIQLGRRDRRRRLDAR